MLVAYTAHSVNENEMQMQKEKRVFAVVLQYGYENFIKSMGKRKTEKRVRWKNVSVQCTVILVEKRRIMAAFSALERANTAVCGFDIIELLFVLIKCTEIARRDVTCITSGIHAYFITDVCVCAIRHVRPKIFASISGSAKLHTDDSV